MRDFDTIYCDFDGTITKNDSVNTFFQHFADPKWIEYENLWIEGKISSRENAIKQVALLPSISPEQLDEYISSIEIDDYFLEFLDYVKSKNIKFTILSDGFDLFIQKVLEQHKIFDIPYFANHLVYENNNFRIEFPNHNPNCTIGAGMCKCAKVKENRFCYIGDGTSDLCIAKKATTLFATKNLKKFCKANDIKYSPFESFCNIIDMLNDIENK